MSFQDWLVNFRENQISCASDISPRFSSLPFRNRSWNFRIQYAFLFISIIFEFVCWSRFNIFICLEICTSWRERLNSNYVFIGPMPSISGDWRMIILTLLHNISEKNGRKISNLASTHEWLALDYACRSVTTNGHARIHARREVTTNRSCPKRIITTRTSNSFRESRRLFRKQWIQNVRRTSKTAAKDEDVVRISAILDHQ